MPGCDPGVGCSTVAAIKNDLAEQRTEAALHSERIKVAADRVEQTAHAFEKCLESIHAHSLSLNDGNRRMDKIEDDVDEIGKLQRDHETRIQCQLRDHETSTAGLHFLTTETINRRFKDLWIAIVVLVGVASVELFVIALHHSESMINAIGKKLGLM